jgi:hypothetical protein
VFTERTSVGLDVHARSVAAAAIDGATGELLQARLTPDHGQILAWVSRLAGPVAVGYEAGPTGFGLYRHLSAAGIDCVVAAPSKLQRPRGTGSRPSPSPPAAGGGAPSEGCGAPGPPAAVGRDHRPCRRRSRSPPGIWCRPGELPRRPDAGPSPAGQAAAAARPGVFRRARVDRQARAVAAQRGRPAAVGGDATGVRRRLRRRAERAGPPRPARRGDRRHGRR